MAILHNAILRGYNSIYLQAPHVEASDYPDFIGYCLSWYKFIKAHHDAEEVDLFPMCVDLLKKEDSEVWRKTHEEHGEYQTPQYLFHSDEDMYMQGSMEEGRCSPPSSKQPADVGNVERTTEAMLPPLNTFNNYLTSLSSPSHLSPPHLIVLLDAIAPSLSTHLHSEIAVIASLSSFGSFPAAEPVLEAWGRNSVIRAGIFDVVPFIFLNIDSTFEDGVWKDWPPVPGPVRWLLVRGSKAWNGEWWKFASCDADGKPRELYALRCEDTSGVERSSAE